MAERFKLYLSKNSLDMYYIHLSKIYYRYTIRIKIKILRCLVKLVFICHPYLFSVNLFLKLNLPNLHIIYELNNYMVCIVKIYLSHIQVVDQNLYSNIQKIL